MRRRQLRPGRAAGSGGFSLVELVVSAAVLGIAFLGLGALFTQGSSSVAESAHQREALGIAQAEIEALAVLPPGSPRLSLDPRTGVTVHPDSLLDAGGGPAAIRILGAAYTSAAACPGLATLPGSPCPGLYRRVEALGGSAFDLDGRGTPYLKKVTIVVAWPDELSDPGRPRMHRVDLETIVAK